MGSGSSISISLFDKSYEYERDALRRKLMEKFKEDPNHQELLSKIKLLRSIITKHPEICRTAARELHYFQNNNNDDSTFSSSSQPSSNSTIPSPSVLPTSKFSAFHELDRLYAIYETSNILKSAECRTGPISCPLGHYMAYFDDFSILRDQVEALDEEEFADALARGKNPITLEQIDGDPSFIVEGADDVKEKKKEEKESLLLFFGRKKNKEKKPIVCSLCKIVITKKLETEEDIIEYNKLINNYPPIQDYDIEKNIKSMKKNEKLAKKYYVKNNEEIEKDKKNDEINKELKHFSFLNYSSGSETPSSSGGSSSDSSSSPSKPSTPTTSSSSDSSSIPSSYKPLLSYGGGYHCSYCFYNLCDLCSKVYCHNGHEMILWTHPEASLTCFVCKEEPITSGYKCIECPKMMKSIEKKKKLNEKKKLLKKQAKEDKRAEDNNETERDIVKSSKKSKKIKDSSLNSDSLAFPTSSLTYCDLDICDYCTSSSGRQYFQSILLKEIKKYMEYIKKYQVESKTAARIISDYENKIKTSTYLTIFHLYNFYLVIINIKKIIKIEKKEYNIRQFIEGLKKNFFTFGLSFSFLFKKFYFFNYYYVKEEKKRVKKLIRYHKSLSTKKEKDATVVSCPLGHAMKPFVGLPDQYKERQSVPLSKLQMKIINKYYKKTIKLIKKNEYKYKKILIKDSKIINFAIQKIMSENYFDFKSGRGNDDDDSDDEDDKKKNNNELDEENELNEEDIERLIIDDVEEAHDTKGVLSSLFLNYDDKYDDDDDEEEEQLMYTEERKKKSFNQIVEMSKNYPHIFQVENNKSTLTYNSSTPSSSTALVTTSKKSNSNNDSIVILPSQTNGNKSKKRKNNLDNFDQFNTIHLNNTSPLFYLLSQLPFPLIVTCSICQRVTSSGHHCDFCQYDLCEVCTPISCAEGHQMTMWCEGESQEHCFLCSSDPNSSSYKYNSFICSSKLFNTDASSSFTSSKCPTISSGYYCIKCDTHMCDMCTSIEGRNKIRANWEKELNELMRFIKSKQHDNNLARYYAWRNNYNIVSLINLINYIKELKIVKSQIILQLKNKLILEHLNLLHNNIVKYNNKISNYSCLKSLDYYYNNKNLIFFNKKIIKQQFYELIKLNKLFFLYKNNTSIKFHNNIACPLNHFMLKINQKNYYSIGHDDFFAKIDEFLMNKSRDFDYFNKDIQPKAEEKEEVIERKSRNKIVHEQEMEKLRLEKEEKFKQEEEERKIKEEKELEYFFYNILPILKTKDKKSKINASTTSKLNNSINNQEIKIQTDKEIQEEQIINDEAKETIKLIQQNHNGKLNNSSDSKDDVDREPTEEELKWRDKVIEERYMLPISPRMKELNHIYNIETNFTSNYQSRVEELPKHFASFPPTLRKEPLCNVCGIGVFKSAEMEKKEEQFNLDSSFNQSNLIIDQDSLSFYHCALCNYNLCGDCSIVYCQYGHSCKIWSHPEAYCLICNSCKQNSITSGYSCQTCCINLCNYCTTKDSRDSMMLIVKSQLVKLLYSIKIIASNNESNYAQQFIQFYHEKINKIIQLFDKTERKTSTNSYDLFSSTYYDNKSESSKNTTIITSTSVPSLQLTTNSEVEIPIPSVTIESLSASKLCKFLNIVKEAKTKIDEEMKEKLNQAKGRNYGVYSRDMI